MLKKGFSIIGLVVLMCACIAVYHVFFVPKKGYVEISKVFNGFEMKKELQQKFERTHAARQKIIDSLSFDLQLLSRELNDKQKDAAWMNGFELKRQDYLKKKKAFDEDNNSLSNQYDKQILEQMTQYINEYGKQEDFDFIYGADGSGVLMYARDTYNISDKVIEFINDKYKGVE